MKMCHTYDDIISIANLYRAWREFLRGKRARKDIAEFSLNLSTHIFNLHEDLSTKNYQHGVYEAFNISDPKPRSIHKATVRDRLLHHAIHRILYPYFDTKFVYDSYSCRYQKGAHRAMDRFDHFARKLSCNNSRICWVLKCDIRKFFASIDHQILLGIIRKYIRESDTIWLIERVIESFRSTEEGKGLPLGNLTSQLLVNVYMNEFDQYVKQTLKIKYYIRYADDFVFLSDDKSHLENLLPKIESFLDEPLKLSLHPNKVSLETMSSGIDFLGWVRFPDHRVLRTVTKRRMFRRIEEKEYNKQTELSYLGMLMHGNARRIEQKLKSLATQTRDF